MSRGSDLGANMVETRPVRDAKEEEGVLATDWKDVERGLGHGLLGTGGKSNDSRVGVAAVVTALVYIGVGGGISVGNDAGGVGGTGTELSPRMR
jgi:hypothetical protein